MEIVEKNTKIKAVNKTNRRQGRERFDLPVFIRDLLDIMSLLFKTELYSINLTIG